MNAYAARTRTAILLAATEPAGGDPAGGVDSERRRPTGVFNLLSRQNPALRTKPPVLVAQGEADSTVFITYTTQLVSELHDLGDHVSYETYPGVDHGGGVSAAESDALAFYRSKLPPRR